jgi:CBS domain-containing protein
MTPLDDLFRVGATTDFVEALAIMKRRGYDVAPWEESNEVKGFVFRENLEISENRSPLVRPLSSLPSVSVGTELKDLLYRLQEKSLLGVMDGGDFRGLVHFADLNRPPIRLLLFALIGQFEYDIAKRWASKEVREVEAIHGLDPESLKRAKTRYEKDRKKDRHLAFCYYLDTPSLLRLAASDDGLLQALDMSGAAFGERYMRLPQTRNSLVHPKRFVQSVDDVNHLSNLIDVLESDVNALL